MYSFFKRDIAMKEISIHCYVSGRVQGVWFRAATKNKVLPLNLTGWVRNLQDGRVEVMATGSEDNLQILSQWLQQGPPGAKVTDVIIQEVPMQEFDRFTID